MAPSNYGSLDAVKERMNLDDDFVEWDNRIERALLQASALIDNLLTGCVPVPIGTPGQVIIDCANDWAAGLVIEESTNPTSDPPPPNPFTKRAKENLAAYMVSQGCQPPPIPPDGGGGGGVVVELPPFSGASAATEYKTDEIKDTWNE